MWVQLLYRRGGDWEKGAERILRKEEGEDMTEIVGKLDVEKALKMLVYLYTDGRLEVTEITPKEKGGEKYDSQPGGAVHGVS